MTDDVPLSWFLYFAAASFCIGLIGVLVRRNAIAVLMAIEIMLNASNINLVAFWRYGNPTTASGPLPGVVLAIFVITVAAAVLTPGQDPISMTLLALPMVFLYELGILLISRGKRPAIA